jgi:hypothetical protein
MTTIGFIIGVGVAGLAALGFCCWAVYIAFMKQD